MLNELESHPKLKDEDVQTHLYPQQLENLSNFNTHPQA